METWDLLRNVWFVLIGILFAGYSVLDGFDLGIGVLFPFLGRTESDRSALFRAIGPLWDGNEVWLITAGGALFAAFPHVYATVFSGFYLALMLVLFALVLRAVSIEFRSHGGTRRRIWEAAFAAGSTVPALLFGVAVGNIVAGVPIDGRMEYTGTFFTLLRPLPLVFGLLGLAAFTLQGATWTALKTPGELRVRAVKAALAANGAVAALFLLSFAMVWVHIPSALTRIPAWVFAGFAAAALVALPAALRRGKDALAFALSSGAFASLWGIVGSILYPDLVRASDPARSLTIYNASSSPLTLKVMLIIAVIGMPIVAAYTIYVYRVFRGKVDPGQEGY